MFITAMQLNAKEGLFTFVFPFPSVCMTRYLVYCVNAAFNHGHGDIASNTRRFEIFSGYVYDTSPFFRTHILTYTHINYRSHVLAVMH